MLHIYNGMLTGKVVADQSAKKSFFLINYKLAFFSVQVSSELCFIRNQI